MFTSNLRARRAALCVVASSLLFLEPGRANCAQNSQKIQPDTRALIQELVQQSDSDEQLTIVWWIPERFWLATLAAKRDVPPAAANALMKALGAYTIVAVVDAKMEASGKLDYTPDDALAAEVFIKDAAGNTYAPFPEDQLAEDTKTIMAMWKPVMTNMLGAFGQHCHFFVFPRRNQKGDVIADAAKEGLFYFDVGKKEFRWRLPVGSLLPHKVCPTCKEELSGAYKYCPYDGTKLPEPIAAPESSRND